MRKIRGTEIATLQGYGVCFDIDEEEDHIAGMSVDVLWQGGEERRKGEDCAKQGILLCQSAWVIQAK